MKGTAMRFSLSLAALLLAGMFVGPLAAQAQDTSRYEVAGGYSFLHDQDISENLHGWVVSGGGRVMNWVDLVGEVGGNYRTISLTGDPAKIKVHTLMVGPKVRASAYGRVTPFAQVLFGAAWASTKVLDVGDSVRDFAYQPGAGVDWKLKPRVGVRLEGDYRIIRAEGSNSKESRLVAAAVFGFGK
jgi:opacity protein-like surface antigen